MRRKVLVAGLALLASAGLFGVTSVHAESFPSKPITILLGYPPGGSADMLARPIAAEMQKRLGQPVIVETKPGAGGTVMTQFLSKAPNDGYTIGLVLAAHAINHSLYPKLTYDARKDFTAISLAATLPLVVAAPLSTPANTIPELIAYAKANPGKLAYASAGNGNTSHLAVELFKSIVGVDMLHVPYKGSAPAVTGMLTGEVGLMFDSISTSLPHIQSGKLKALAVSGSTRSPMLPNTPTVAESVPDFIVDGWYGFIGPAKMPAEVVNKLSETIAEIVKEPKMKERLAKLGYASVGSGPQEFGAHIAAEIDRWAPVVTKSGAKVD